MTSDGKHASVPITVSFINDGPVGLYVLAATYSVVGRRGSVLPEGGNRSDAQMRIDISNRGPATRWAEVQGYELIQSDEFLEGGNLYRPGDRSDTGRVVDLPLPNHLDSIAINAFVIVAREDSMRLQESVLPAYYSWKADGIHESKLPKWIDDLGLDKAAPDFVRYDVPIQEKDYLGEKTRRQWKGSIWRVLGLPDTSYPPGEYLTWRFTPDESADDPEAPVDSVRQSNLLATARYMVSVLPTRAFTKSQSRR